MPSPSYEKISAIINTRIYGKIIKMNIELRERQWRKIAKKQEMHYELGSKPWT